MSEKVKNNINPIYLVLIFFIMLGLSYASVPLYELFCKVTGFGGTPKTSKQAPNVVIDHNIVTRFDTNVSKGLFWEFKAEKNKEIFKLDDWTSEYLSKIDLITRQFILNQGDGSIIAELNLTGLHHILGVLAADEKTSQIFDNLEEKQLEKEELIIKFFEEIIRMKDEKEKDFVDDIA